VNSQISLPVAVKVERAQHNAALDGHFENTGRDGLFVPRYQARPSYVNGNDFHDV
jgi:hypothetical protein